MGQCCVKLKKQTPNSSVKGIWNKNEELRQLTPKTRPKSSTRSSLSKAKEIKVATKGGEGPDRWSAAMSSIVAEETNEADHPESAAQEEVPPEPLAVVETIVPKVGVRRNTAERGKAGKPILPPKHPLHPLNFKREKNNSTSSLYIKDTLNRPNMMRYCGVWVLLFCTTSNWIQLIPQGKIW